MATMHPEWSGAIPMPGAAPPIDGPLMTLRELATLAQAPRRPFGTEVSVRATSVPATAGFSDHMFVHYDDGRAQLIARGGPTESGLRLFSGAARTAAEVTPEASSRDRGVAYRTMASTFLPGVSADQAAADARAHALGVDRFGNDYGVRRNSNSYAADVAEPIFGMRPGDRRTPGFEHRLYDGPPPIVQGSVFTGPLDPDDLTPIVRTPPY